MFEHNNPPRHINTGRLRKTADFMYWHFVLYYDINRINCILFHFELCTLIAWLEINWRRIYFVVDTLYRCFDNPLDLLFFRCFHTLSSTKKRVHLAIPYETNAFWEGLNMCKIVLVRLYVCYDVLRITASVVKKLTFQSN